jgi:hypothetical protein
MTTDSKKLPELALEEERRQFNRAIGEVYQDWKKKRPNWTREESRHPHVYIAEELRKRHPEYIGISTTRIQYFLPYLNPENAAELEFWCRTGETSFSSRNVEIMKYQTSEFSYSEVSKTPKGRQEILDSLVVYLNSHPKPKGVHTRDHAHKFLGPRYGIGRSLAFDLRSICQTEPFRSRYIEQGEGPESLQKEKAAALREKSQATVSVASKSSSYPVKRKPASDSATSTVPSVKVSPLGNVTTITLAEKFDLDHYQLFLDRFNKENWIRAWMHPTAAGIGTDGKVAWAVENMLSGALNRGWENWKKIYPEIPQEELRKLTIELIRPQVAELLK